MLKMMTPNSNNNKWNFVRIVAQGRWGVANAVLLIRSYKPSYDALVKAIKSGKSIGECVIAIESALPPAEKLPTVQWEKDRLIKDAKDEKEAEELRKVQLESARERGRRVAQST